MKALDFIKRLRRPKEEIDTAPTVGKYWQLGGQGQQLDVSPVTGLPSKFTVMGEKYCIDEIGDISRFPKNFSSFDINGTRIYFNNYFRLCADVYEKKGQHRIAVALRKKADELESDLVFGKFMKGEANNVRSVEELLPKASTSPRAELVRSVYEKEPLVYEDYLFAAAVDVAIDVGSISASILQRRLKIGYARAARIIDSMKEFGIVESGRSYGTYPVIVTKSRWAEWQNDFVFKEKVNVDTEQIIKDEQEWLRKQRGLSPIDEELYQIDHMDGHQFEHWCADLLRDSGFINVEVTPGSNDQGVDVLAEQSGIKYAVQCKCYSSDLGNTPVQEVTTGKYVYRCHIGAVMTNRYFTAGAKEAAEATGTLLWDRDTIREMLKGYVE